MCNRLADENSFQSTRSIQIELKLGLLYPMNGTRRGWRLKLEIMLSSVHNPRPDDTLP